MWQTPALAMTAMAFLLTLALNDNGASIPRIVVGALSLVVAMSCLQLMAAHWHYRQDDEGRLEELSNKEMPGMLPVHTKSDGKFWRKRDKGEPWYMSFRSHNIWYVVLFSFGAVSVFAIVWAACNWRVAGS